jgi:hypothetical protein
MFSMGCCVCRGLFCLLRLALFVVGCTVCLLWVVIFLLTVMFVEGNYICCELLCLL